MFLRDLVYFQKYEGGFERSINRALNWALSGPQVIGGPFMRDLYFNQNTKSPKNTIMIP